MQETGLTRPGFRRGWFCLARPEVRPNLCPQ